MAKIAIAVAKVAIRVAVSYAANYLARPKPTSQPLQHPEVSSAANGAPIPIPSGIVRVAGQVIWSSGISAVQFEL